MNRRPASQPTHRTRGWFGNSGQALRGRRRFLPRGPQALGSHAAQDLGPARRPWRRQPCERGCSPLEIATDGKPVHRLTGAGELTPSDLARRAGCYGSEGWGFESRRERSVLRRTLNAPEISGAFSISRQTRRPAPCCGVLDRPGGVDDLRIPALALILTDAP